MKMEQELKIKSVKEMQELAVEVARKLQGGEVLLLYGELGSGKTTFVQGLARVLGVKERVTSPTFTIVSEYEIAGKGDIQKLVHVDLYRLAVGEAARDAAVQEVLERADERGRLTIIEWADRLGSGISGKVWRIKFAHGKNLNERAVVICKAKKKS